MGSVDGTGPRTLKGFEISKLIFSRTITWLTTRIASALKGDFRSLVKSKVEYNKFAMYKESSNQRTWGFGDQKKISYKMHMLITVQNHTGKQFMLYRKPFWKHSL